MAEKKRKQTRSTPWVKLAKEIAVINPALPAKEVDQKAYELWFESACPCAAEALEGDERAYLELYEQLSGRFFSEAEEEKPEEQ